LYAAKSSFIYSSRGFEVRDSSIIKFTIGEIRPEVTETTFTFANKYLEAASGSHWILTGLLLVTLGKRIAKFVKSGSRRNDGFLIGSEGLP
jgi:hypothetical protein